MDLIYDALILRCRLLINRLEMAPVKASYNLLYANIPQDTDGAGFSSTCMSDRSYDEVVFDILKVEAEEFAVSIFKRSYCSVCH